jgi:glycerol kinase
MKYLLALDHGTTSSRAVVYDCELNPVSAARREFPQYFPKPGWVEHDAMEIWESVVGTGREAVESAGISASDILAVGMTNQRETVVLWERKTGHPVHRAIVWQDRRTEEYLAALRECGKESLIQERTGLLADPYFSASKLHWMLREIPDGHKRAANGELAAGTVDSWMIYKLTNGREHVTDVSNASRTMLMNLEAGTWDEEMLSLFDIPRALLPNISPTSSHLGVCSEEWFGAPLPITACVGDQQAALFGQLCTSPGMVKCTYGTGCFLLKFLGENVARSHNRLLSTVAWKLGDAPIQYALEGSVFMGGAAIQWLRDGLGILRSAPEVNELAGRVQNSGGVVLVPAFTGLGAPYWDASARGLLIGMTRGTTSAHIARATLDAIACQVTDLITAMDKDSKHPMQILRVDGGASASDLLMQCQADLCGVEVERPENIETTALGAAMLAGLGAGVWKCARELHDRPPRMTTFTPAITTKDRRGRLKVWKRAVRRAQNWEQTL